jgi:cyanophycinase
MPGSLVLEGGAEFGGRMADVDRQALSLAGGVQAPVVILPTAAAPDHNHQHAGNNGLHWFRSLGATNISLAMVIDQVSANNPENARAVRSARLIYLLGGFPAYLEQTLRGSSVWAAALEAYQSGAVIAGSSAGAMVLCEDYFDPGTGQTRPGLGLLPRTCVIPHHNTFGQQWAGKLRARLPQSILMGIAEQTGIVSQAGEQSTWTVYGGGEVTVYFPLSSRVFRPKDEFKLPAD